MATSTIVIIGIVLSLLFIAFFAGYEIAFISGNRLNTELKKKQGKRSGLIISRFMEHPAQFIGTCLVGLNFFLVGYGLLFDELLRLTFWNPLHIQNEYLKLVFDTLLSAVVVLIVGEFIPKAIFRAKADSALHFFAPISSFFHQLFLPVTNLFVGISQWILKYLFNVKTGDKSSAFSKVDLEHFFQQNKVLDEDKQELNTELFENALSLPGIKIRQCLVPRTEIEAISVNSTMQDAATMFITTRLSKLIVYDVRIDNIVGYIHQLDLFKKPTSIKNIIHPIPVVPETMSATDLMNKFSKERKSIAWVVDEFGGTAGIITMEDLLEEIFGEIQDEYDTDDFVEKQIAEDEFILSGRLELDALTEKYNLQFPEHDSETLSGYIINHHETIPKRSESIIIENYQFDILTVSDTRIDMVKLKILR
ncbi:hemolysin family protein [Parasediminibacterium sp. JCM 36343]|uniref:hemolysin family protein n=1 Tax=Parasediminibacterium sp. JCM 36343 TaxID=3374279 RepID=UPI003978E5C1